MVIPIVKLVGRVSALASFRAPGETHGANLELYKYNAEQISTEATFFSDSRLHCERRSKRSRSGISPACFSIIERQMIIIISLTPASKVLPALESLRIVQNHAWRVCL
jgi:hypothetical protein